MKKILSLGLLSTAFLVSGNASKAIELQHGIDAGIGYVAQINTGDFAYTKEQIDFAKNNGNKLTNAVNQLSLHIGYNATFKVSEYFNPILGAFVSGYIPLNNNSVVNGYFKTKSVTSNIVDINAKIGNKFNVCKNFSIDLYYFIGANIGLVKAEIAGATDSNAYGGFSTGIGVDANYRSFLFGVYYKYTDMRMNGVVFNKANNIGFKLGYRFSI